MSLVKGTLRDLILAQSNAERYYPNGELRPGQIPLPPEGRLVFRHCSYCGTWSYSSRQAEEHDKNCEPRENFLRAMWGI